MKTLWRKLKLLALSNFFFCRNVFKTPSAAKALESVYMRERFKERFWRPLKSSYDQKLSMQFNPFLHKTSAAKGCENNLKKIGKTQ